MIGEDGVRTGRYSTKARRSLSEAPVLSIGGQGRDNPERLAVKHPEGGYIKVYRNMRGIWNAGAGNAA